MGKNHGKHSGYDWPHGPAGQKGLTKGRRVRFIKDNREGEVFATDVGMHKNVVTVQFDDKTAGSYFMSALELIDK